MASLARFASDGFAELGRKLRRGSLTRRLRALDDTRQKALAALGRDAWTAGLDLTPFAAQRDDIVRLIDRAGTLAAATQKLDAERTEWQSRREQEMARGDALLKPVFQRQTESDTAVRAARAVLADCERSVREAEAKAVAAEVASAKAARDRAAADLAARSAESKQCADQAAKIQADRRTALQPIDAELKRLAEESGRTGRETAAVGSEQDKAFANLGTALHEKTLADPAVAAQTQAVDALDTERTAVQGEIDDSLRLTRAMPAGTMLLFAAVFVGVPIAAIAVAFFLPRRGEPSATVESELVAARPSAGAGSRVAITAPGSARQAAVEADEQQRDRAVQAYLDSPADAGKRDRAVEILREDLHRIGSTADRGNVPDILTMARHQEPELRASALEALGMIGPRGDEVPLLLDAANDPIPAIRAAALRALGQARGHAGAALVVQLASLSPRIGSQNRERLRPEPVPDERRLNVPLYPGAVYLHYISDSQAGRAAFATSDAVQKVVDFYAAKSGRPALDGETVSRTYFGASSSDRTGMRRAGDEMEAWVREVVKANRPGAELEAEMQRRTAAVQNLPLVRYADAALYGTPRYVVLEERAQGNEKRAVRWVAILEQPALQRVLVEIHVPGEASPAPR